MSASNKVSATSGDARTRSEKGAILYIVAFGMIVFLGMAGLAIDLGMLYNVKTDLQNATDAAALAGGVERDFAAGGVERAVHGGKAEVVDLETRISVPGIHGIGIRRDGRQRERRRHEYCCKSGFQVDSPLLV